MFRAIGIAAVMLSMFFIVGGHWVVLQSVAWTRMMCDYSRTSSLAEAAQKTFGGNNPCSMCKKIGESKSQEDQIPELIKADKKVDAFVAAISDLLSPPSPSAIAYRAFDVFFSQRIHPPSEPVPLNAFTSIS